MCFPVMGGARFRAPQEGRRAAAAGGNDCADGTAMAVQQNTGYVGELEDFLDGATKHTAAIRCRASDVSVGDLARIS